MTKAKILLGLALLAFLALFFLAALLSHPGSIASLRHSAAAFWNTINKGGDPFECLESGNMKGLETILKSHPELARERRNGYTPLHVVYTVEGARILLDNGAEIDVPLDARDHELSPLHNQIMRRNTSVALFLIDRGASVNKLDLRGRSPLHLAAKMEEVEVVHALLKKGAAPEQPDGEGRRVIDYLKTTEPSDSEERSAKRDQILKLLEGIKK